MSNRDTRLTKQWKCPQFVTLFCQIIAIQSQSEVTCEMQNANYTPASEGVKDQMIYAGAAGIYASSVACKTTG